MTDPEAHLKPRLFISTLNQHVQMGYLLTYDSILSRPGPQTRSYQKSLDFGIEVRLPTQIMRQDCFIALRMLSHLTIENLGAPFIDDTSINTTPRSPGGCHPAVI